MDRREARTAELQNRLSFRINNINVLYVSADIFYGSLWMRISLFLILENGLHYKRDFAIMTST